jgi:hypothetical protein
VLRALVRVAPAGQPPERPDQAEVSDGVGGLGAVMGLEVGHEIERPAVVGAVVDAAQRHDAQGVVAAAERPRHEVRGVHARARAADDARRSSGVVALGG